MTRQTTATDPGGPPHRPAPTFCVVALAASAGGLAAISRILSGLPADFPAAVLVVLHRTAQEPFQLPDLLSRRTPLRVEQAREGTALRPATVFVAPPDWHLLVNVDGTLSLSRSAKVKSVRPSADRLFESLAAGFKERAIAVVLTGADGDGSGGVPIIKKMGGVVIAQDAATAEVPGMPLAAIATGAADRILPLEEIAPALVTLVAPERGEA
jgi:two-component system, chemotaxis family, protein-glutamate methylesterase/glutaminase